MAVEAVQYPTRLGAIPKVLIVFNLLKIVHVQLHIKGNLEGRLEPVAVVARFRPKADNFDLADVDLRGTQVPTYSQVQMKQ